MGNYLELGDGRIYYEDSGAQPGRATVVFNHAAFLDSRMWDDQWTVFGDRFRVIRYDMRGFGQSDPVTGPRCRRRDLWLLLDHLYVEAAHLVGCSMGGEIVLDMALEQPECIQSLTIVNGAPSGFQPEGAPPEYLFEMMGALQQGDSEGASEYALRIWFDGPQRTPDQVDAVIRQRASMMNRICIAQNTFFIADSQPLDPLDPPAITRLDHIRVPTLIVEGTLDHSENLRAGTILREGISGAAYLPIPNAAHVPSLEQPAHFNPAVLSFLKAQ
jgi:pimeloyl-ACP methyl ester carboxylesterase